ncbi:MAG: CopG family transcriptional regulator [Microcoleus sp. PH2017_10_PVI_O_A]|nr:CopG family transcriptional regulator [Microcoleus sp. PH2017_10_PVI_O_A]MCC3459069.1 CopG family transcriptional regulator [Microcoleus sp. PH2017_11_PCY_U_A]MCC3478979.1 CopG family transcriptional regulator [Microcoleus sp. PH2017_12_PCY_D_A]MCC3529212.1 CopG family transcriptional regulator [Microcoleus sp. PH2017_21_RUC_O_A]MCC3541444.1 CopG family transcriptional regulator [Microcoleus sp. PH2017_22_RUC_O_B]MCC3559914.1 CopG family transcriptional regulator [Microcoleus sp. PH2017_27_
MGGKRQLESIAVYVTKEKKEALEEWATSEERSVSWIVSKAIDKALQEYQQQNEAKKDT